MKFTISTVAALMSVAATSSSAAASVQSDASDRAALSKMSLDIRQAFARGDVAVIMACHDDRVEKSFQPGARLVGKPAVEADLRKTLANNDLTFVSNDVESLFIQGDVGVEQTRFVIEGRPKTGANPWTFKGRTQVVYVRNPASPCGWSTVRELVQPAN